MMKNTRYLFLAASLLALAACGGGEASAGGGDGDGDVTAGGDTAYAGPIGSEDVAKGQEMYAQACEVCHSDGNAPAIENIAWPAARMRQQIREGEDSMPPIPESRLSNDDMEAVLAYLVTIGGVTP